MEEEVIETILPRNDADFCNCTLEIKHATGGSESSLFAEDLMYMYEEYAR
jgi:protein subunit release factor A